MTTYLIVNRETKTVVQVPGNGVGCWKAARYQTLGAAKSAITRMKKRKLHHYMGGKRAPTWCLDVEKYAIYIYPGYVDIGEWINNLDQYRAMDNQVERVNIMTGKTYMEDANTASCCSPSSETYWSM
jgi:hypothetical protein